MISLVVGIGVLSFGRKLRRICRSGILEECVARTVPIWIDIANM